jgi:hypothetical protein
MTAGRRVARIASGVLLTLLMASLTAAPARAQANDALQELLDGVTTIAAPGTPSPLAVWSKDAYVVLGGSGGKGLRAAAIVGGRAGSGRFVALPHNGYFGGDALKKGDTTRFVINSARWLGGLRKPALVATRSPELHALLSEDPHAKAAKLEFKLLAAGPLVPQLDGVDVLLGLTPEFDAGEIDALEKWVRAGGGVLAGQCAWGWLQVSGKASLDENPLQQLFGRFGVAWCEGFLGKSGPEGFTTERDPPKLTHGDAAFTYLSNHTQRGTVKNDQPMLQSSATITALARVLPPGDTMLRPRLEAICDKRAEAIAPTAEKPLERIDGGERAMATFLLREALRLPAEQVKAMVAAARIFPGEVPAAAPRGKRSVAIDTARPRWHSTGVYAVAGEVVTLTVPATAASAGLSVQIGAHTDLLFDLDKWSRVPQAFVRKSVAAATTTIASPLGGLVYVDVPDGCKLGALDVELDGGVAAPWFVLGRDTDETWRASLREAPAPWAELECDRVIVTVPSSALRGLDSPKETLETWIKGVDAMADLVGLPRARLRPERYVADVQISAGYMHSGYPIMTHLDAAPAMSSAAELAKGQWGLFHELGHNHQEAEWTFEGTGEVTNNLLCVYALEQAYGVPVMKGHEALEATRAKIGDYLAAGAKFDDWKADPFLALQMYLQVQQAFGWEPYKKLFADYRALPRRERPRTDDAKRDLWLVMLSKATDRDLGPFFTAWGVPTSDAARASVSDRAPWMPEGFPPK